MKNLILLLTASALICPAAAGICRADYQDMSDQVETTANVWVGGYLNDTSNSKNEGFADKQTPALPEAAGRQGTLKASEFYSLDSSASGGFLFKSAPLPNRFHFEFDFYNDNDWFGDLRYSYKDYLQIRLLPRRFFHNLDNVTIYNFGTDTVDIQDALVDDYGLRIDIDQAKLRLKTPNYPMHFYADGEIVRRKGKRQMIFLGGSAYFTNRDRVSQSREIDQEKKEVGFAGNSHLGPVELEFEHRNREFESDVAPPTYAYFAFGPPFSPIEHNVTPKLKADTNTFKVHTSHTGRLFASGTYSKISKTNETSQAEADNTLGYGELVWLPVSYLSFTAKYRTLKNESENGPATVDGQNFNGGTTTHIVHHGVESVTNTASLGMRYSLIPSTNVRLIYTNQIKKLEGESAVNWGRPPKQTRNIYELNFTNWAISKLRVTGKYRHTNIDTEFGDFAAIEPVNNDPEHTNLGVLGLTWTISPKVVAFANANVVKEDTDHNRMFTGITDAEQAKALREHYLASLSFSPNEKLTITPTYTYMSWKQERDLAWEYQFETADPDLTTTGDVTEGRHIVDSDYRNKLTAQNFALNVGVKPVKRLNVNGAFEYTITKGVYEPRSYIMMSTRVNDGVVAQIPMLFSTADIATLSETDTKELTVRLDTDFDMGRGWGLGLDLRYTDWKDESSDNPSDGTYLGGLLMFSKKFISR